MLKKNKTPKFLKRFITNRKGTAEVIGSVLFIIILLFAFTNIYLWYDNATKTMNTLLSEKLNSQIVVHWEDPAIPDGLKNTLLVTNAGGVGTSLSRLWIVTPSGEHAYADLEHVDGGDRGLYVAPGSTVKIWLSGSSSLTPSVGDNWATDSNNQIDYQTVRVYYTPNYASQNPQDPTEPFTVLTMLGNMASPEGTLTIVNVNNGNGNGGNAPIGSIIVANYDTFECNIYSGSTLYASSSGYHVTLSKADVQANNYEIEFKVTLTNNDLQGRTVNLLPGSQMFFIGSKNTGGNTVSYVGLPITQGVTIASGASAPVSFRANLSNFGFSAGSVGNDYTYALNLVLVGNIGGTQNPLGQNIPFVSISITVTN